MTNMFKFLKYIFLFFLATNNTNPDKLKKNKKVPKIPKTIDILNLISSITSPTSKTSLYATPKDIIDNKNITKYIAGFLILIVSTFLFAFNKSIILYFLITKLTRCAS